MKVACVVGFLFLVVLCSGAVADPCLWGTSSAEVTNDPGFEGLWKYCLDIYWDFRECDGYGLSYAALFTGLFQGCPCSCYPGYFAFADTVGYGPGTTDGHTCTVYYYCQLLCSQDPNIPDGEPVIKFLYYEDDCEPDKFGWMHVCFYSVAQPTAPGVFEDVLGAKFGPCITYGDLEGVMPTCDWSYSETQPGTWASIKALFR